MKRSYMVLLIAESLVEPRYEDVIEEASFILRRLEKKGMLPPNDWHHGVPLTPEAAIEQHEWEEENEEI